MIGPAADEAAAKTVLAALQKELADATHHCWAWRLGSPPRERSSDARLVLAVHEARLAALREALADLGLVV